jgi:magnesium-transporting ATPase (P-type)
MTISATAATTSAGLSEAEAARALEQHGPNAIAETAPPGILPRVLMQLRDPMILLLLGAAVLTAKLHDLTDLAVILVVVTLNIARRRVRRDRGDPWPWYRYDVPHRTRQRARPDR